MTLTATWGPTVSSTTGAGAIQDIPVLIDFLAEPDAGSSVGIFNNPNEYGMTALYLGQQITMIAEGSGIGRDNSGNFVAQGQFDVMYFHLGAASYLAFEARPADVFLTIEGTVQLSELFPALDNDASGQDSAALENFIADQNWVYNGIGADDAIPANARSSDNVPIVFNGDDLFELGRGNDTMYAGLGEDTVKGGVGQDLLYGQSGADLLAGGKGQDTIHGGGGDDSIVGQADNDYLLGSGGNDTVKGGGGVDVLDGGNGNDFLKGGVKDDVARGSFGNDRVAGNKGNDDLEGGEGHDTLNGGGGNDNLIGGVGNDRLKGGLGDDAFVFFGSMGEDTVVDFEIDGDVVELIDVFAPDAFEEAISNASQQGAHVRITLANDSSVVLQNVDLDDLTADNFMIYDTGPNEVF